MTCPTCSKLTNNDFAPFCSERCKNIDLFKWLNEKYIIESQAEESSENFDLEEDPN